MTMTFSELKELQQQRKARAEEAAYVADLTLQMLAKLGQELQAKESQIQSLKAKCDCDNA